MQKVTWVARCIDAIAGNQARLPMVLKKENSPQGEILTGSRNELLHILNSKSNDGENSFIFRYRLSSQLLMSTRGVFIEKVRGRSGKIIALHLLPPQYTSPIPDPKTFVSGYEVRMPGSNEPTIIKPDDVIWVRRPHPLDPYLSLTPMESAGIAIEIENLAKVYNRNYLLNDGRPGGLLVIRGEVDDDDKEEIRSRFRGNMSRVGGTTVLSSEDGVDYIDTSSNPRDAAYIQMRQITKEEILAAFGVPESVIGNASGRTFSNASEEIRVFWMETMLPHLEPISRALDDLDERYYVDFDTSSVPIMIVAKNERTRYFMDEFQNGLISANEYRIASGRPTVEADLADSLLANPNLTPIANTEKPMAEPQQPQGAPAFDPNALPPMSPDVGMGMPPEQAPAPDTMAGALAQEQAGAPVEGAVQTTQEPLPDGQLSVNFAGMEVKVDNSAISDWDIKAEQSSDRWSEIVDRALERYFERQQRVVLEKATGAKSKKALTAGQLSIESIFDKEMWNKQLREDMAPMLMAIVKDASDMAQEQTGMDSAADEEEVKAYVEEQLSRMEKVNDTTNDEIAAAVLVALALMGGDESGIDKSSLLRSALIAIFANLLSKRKRMIAEHEAQTAYNAGTYFSGKQVGALTKTWLTRRDTKVRPNHQFLQGKTVELGNGFTVDGAVLRFPGDPLAPAALTINCRCRLRFNID
jgi:HK97 family phage portal protein